jgi:hypothetical protein
MHRSPTHYLSIAALGLGAALALSATASAAEWDTHLRGTNSVYAAPQQAEPQQQRQQQATQPAATTVAKQGSPSGSQGNADGATRLQR